MSEIATGYYLLIGLVLVASAIAAVIVIGNRGGTSFQATIENILPYDPSRIMVSFHVANFGTDSATPTCQIAMNSPGGTSTGLATFEADRPILPSHRASYHVMVSVMPYGASYSVTINPSVVTCH